MAQTAPQNAKHTLQIENRARLTATGIVRVDFFSDTLISAETSDGALHIKGEGLYIENMSGETGELLVRGRVLALSYEDGVKPQTLLQRIFK